MAVTGTDAITTAFVDEYTTNVRMLSQQGMSKLRNAVTNKSAIGENSVFFEQVGEASGQRMTQRHGPTPVNPVPMDRRWVTPEDWNTADLVDKVDELRMIIDPRAPIARAQAAFIGRTIDDIIIEAAFGTALTGKDRSTSVTFPAGQVVGTAAERMTIDKLLQTKQLFEEADVDFDMSRVYMVLTPEQKRDLLNTTKVTSADYNTVKALAQGEINAFLGFNFITSNRLPGGTKYNTDIGTVTPAANSAQALAFVDSGLGLATWNDINSRITEESTLNYSWQVYTQGTFGATRIEEVQVVKIVSGLDS